MNEIIFISNDNLRNAEQFISNRNENTKKADNDNEDDDDGDGGCGDNGVGGQINSE